MLSFTKDIADGVRSANSTRSTRASPTCVPCCCTPSRICSCVSGAGQCYSATSIRERVYGRVDDDTRQAGILLYTAAPDSEGTLKQFDLFACVHAGGELDATTVPVTVVLEQVSERVVAVAVIVRGRWGGRLVRPRAPV